MNDKLLKILKSEYDKRREDEEYQNELLEKIAKLEENEVVKEYISLLKEVNVSKSNESSYENMLYGCFKKNIELLGEDVDNVYVCLGTYASLVQYYYDIMLEKDDFRAEYRIYKNIENGKDIKVFMKDFYEFEKNNIVIFPNTMLTNKAFLDIQKEYISTLVIAGKEEAYKRILRRNS